ncbi:hypothetical protein HanRHA438_Chr05g0219081 [Helianthus annuus]|nr:hypothetical protein HanRHA438_Chr05g0219081 [Helianthus annuus]
MHQSAVPTRFTAVRSTIYGVSTKDLLQPSSLHLSSNLQNPTSEHPLLPPTPSEITAEP